MEFADVLRKRKMVRTFEDRPIDPATVERILAAGARAPSAGFSQGFSFLALSGREETARFWEAVARDDPAWPNEGLRRAPLLVVALAGKHVYLVRYAQEDKGWTDRDEGRWPVPYWLVDTSFAAMLMLLEAVDQGLGALFFGLDAEGYGAVRKAFGVPPEWEPIGIIAAGHAGDDRVRSSASRLPRKRLAEIVHRGRW